MARVDLQQLAALLMTHPRIELLAEFRCGPLLLEASGPLSKHIIGAVDHGEQWLVKLLEEVAPHEMALTRGICRGNMLRTVTVTASLLTHLAPFFEQAPDAEPASEESGGEGEGDEGEGEGQGEDAGGDEEEGVGGGGGSEEEDEGEGQGESGPGDQVDLQSIMDNVFDDLTEQNTALETLHEFLPGMGWSFGRSHLEEAMLRDMTLMARLIAQAGELRQIVDELGRLEDSERHRRTPENGGREAVVGVRVGGELSDVLPSELALLADESTELLFYQRYADRRLLTLELTGPLDDPVHEGARRGPVIACVDTSGSMRGHPEAVAKALILAVIRRVLPQGRQVRLMLFGGRGDFRDVDIGRGVGSLNHLLEFLAMSFHAGTDFDGPLQRAVELLEVERYERADILLVTDGYCAASPHIVQQIEDLREELGFEVVSVVVGGSPRGVAPFSDRVWLIPRGRSAADHIDLRIWEP